MPESEELTFEQALQRLEQIVSELDAGDMPLEASIKLFEEGMKLKALCVERLEKAQAVVEQYAPATEAGADEPETEQEEA